MSVFIDTSAFFAVLDSDDRNHARADSVWNELLKSDNALFTNNYVLVETYTLLQHRFGLDAVGAFSSDIIPVLKIIWVTELMHRVAVHSLLAAYQRRLSLVDCACFETIRDLGLDSVFCFDRHFKELGFQVIPD